MTDKNSLLYWFPKTENLGIRVPKTISIKDEYDLVSETIPIVFIKKIKKIISKNFTLPVFIRTDLASNKWRWNKSCYLVDINNLSRNLWEVIEFNQMADMIGLPFEAICIREYIPMKKAFEAFWGMPINPERRYFIKDGKVLCHHPYWPVEAIKFHTRKVKNWQNKLEKVNRESKKEIAILTEYTQRVANVFEGFWSVDFCLSATDEWILIDMAEGEKSWHPECKYKAKG